MTLRDREGIEELHALLLELFPDPVDLLEDELAGELGLRRHPSLSYTEWREARVRAIDAGEDGLSRVRAAGSLPEGVSGGS